MDNITKNLLNELEKTQKQFWNIAPETANFISMLIKMTKPANVLEIGTSNGYSALWISDALKYNKITNNSDGHLTTIEFYEERQSVAKGYFEQTGLNGFITPLQGPAIDVLNKIDLVPDMVFIDANKSQYKDYFHILDKRLKKGAIILADNVLSHEEKVKPFVDEIMSSEDYQAEILTLPAGLLMAYKLV